jgi:hypothetical protein
MNSIPIFFPEDLVTVSHTFQSWLVSSPSSNNLGSFLPLPQMYLFLSTSAPYDIAAIQFLLTSPPERPPPLDFLYHIGPGTHFSGYGPLRHATFAQQGTFLRATASSFRDSRLAWIQIFLMIFLFRHATFAQRDTFLQAAADFPLDPLFPQVFSFLFWWHSVARLQTLRRFLGSPTSITVASPLGIS